MPALPPNAHRLLRALVLDGPAHRADLARALDVSRATISNLTTKLIAGGWLEEMEGEPGSLKNPIGTSPSLGVLGSIVFLVDSYTVAVAGYDGRVLGELTLFASVGSSAEVRIAAAAEALVTLLDEHGLAPALLRSLYLAVDTQMDAQSGRVYAQRASSRWYGSNPKEYFEQRFGVPVHTQNTARLEGLAEYLWGVGGDRGDMAYVEVSHGITSGRVVDGVIRSGARGGAGELGHMVYDWDGPLCTCGNTGCLMQYSSIPAILASYAVATGTAVAWEDFVARAAEEDPTAVRIAERAAEILGRVLVNLCHLTDPDTVVLSGEVAHALPMFVATVAETVQSHALPLVARNVRILPAELPDARSATARAGIESLRRIETVIVSAVASS